MHSHFLIACTGCGTVWSMDGNWKLTYPICMFQVPKCGKAFSGKLRYASSCPKEPLPGMAFCGEHCNTADKLGVPKSLHGYLEHCRQKKLAVSGSATLSQIEENVADCQGIITNACMHAGHMQYCMCSIVRCVYSYLCR